MFSHRWLFRPNCCYIFLWPHYTSLFHYKSIHTNKESYNSTRSWGGGLWPTLNDVCFVGWKMVLNTEKLSMQLILSMISKINNRKLSCFLFVQLSTTADIYVVLALFISLVSNHWNEGLHLNFPGLLRETAPQISMRLD